MRLPPSVLAATASLVLAAACQGPSTGPSVRQTSPVADATSEGVRFRNATERPIYYVAFESEFATRASLAPCTDPVRCPSVAPRGEVAIPLRSIEGYRAGAREVVIYWWHLLPRGDGTHALDSLRMERVALAH